MRVTLDEYDSKLEDACIRATNTATAFIDTQTEKAIAPLLIRLDATQADQDNLMIWQRRMEASNEELATRNRELMARLTESLAATTCTCSTEIYHPEKVVTAFEAEEIADFSNGPDEDPAEIERLWAAINYREEHRRAEENLEWWSPLGVDEDASFDVVRASYLNLARELHPDVNGDEGDRIRQITKAWNFYRNKVARPQPPGVDVILAIKEENRAIQTDVVEVEQLDSLALKEDAAAVVDQPPVATEEPAPVSFFAAEMDEVDKEIVRLEQALAELKAGGVDAAGIPSAPVAESLDNAAEPRTGSPDLTTAGLAEILSCNRATIAKWRESGQLQAKGWEAANSPKTKREGWTYRRIASTPSTGIDSLQGWQEKAEAFLGGF